jgi:hypothetical protein
MTQSGRRGFAPAVLRLTGAGRAPNFIDLCLSAPARAAMQGGNPANAAKTPR